MTQRAAEVAHSECLLLPGSVLYQAQDTHLIHSQDNQVRYPYFIGEVMNLIKVTQLISSQVLNAPNKTFALCPN